MPVNLREWGEVIVNTEKQKVFMHQWFGRNDGVYWEEDAGVAEDQSEGWLTVSQMKWILCRSADFQYFCF